MKTENLKKLKSTNPVVENALEYAANKACGKVCNEGTSEGAKKGWETRKTGGAGGAKDDPWAKDRGSKGPERWHFDDSKTPTESNFKNLKKGDMIPSPYSDTMVEVKSIIVDGDVGIIDAVTEDGDEWEIHAEDYGIEHPGGKKRKDGGGDIKSAKSQYDSAMSEGEKLLALRESRREAAHKKMQAAIASGEYRSKQSVRDEIEKQIADAEWTPEEKAAFKKHNDMAIALAKKYNFG